MENGRKSAIYLDYNATTPVHPDVIRVLSLALLSYGNPSSSYNPTSNNDIENQSTHTSTLIKIARRHVANLISNTCTSTQNNHDSNETENQIVFTSGATEALNYAIKGAAFEQRRRFNRDHIISAETEHPACLSILSYLSRCHGFQVVLLKVNKFGQVSKEQVIEAMTDKTCLVSLMLANNETGALNHIKHIYKAVRDKDKQVLLHTDASQAIGKMVVDVDDLGVDLMTIAGHKFQAPKGIGCLFIRSGVELETFMHGANQERGRRGGTENVPYIAAIGEAARLAQLNLSSTSAHMSSCRDYLLSRLSSSLTRICESRNKLDEEDAQRQQTNVIPKFKNVDGVMHVIAKSSSASSSLPNYIPIYLINTPLSSFSSSSSSSSFSASSPSPCLCLPNTLSISFAHLSGGLLLHDMSSLVLASAGAACHSSSSSHVSHVLSSIGVPPSHVYGTLRLSVGAQSTMEEITMAADCIAEHAVRHICMHI